MDCETMLAWFEAEYPDLDIVQLSDDWNEVMFVETVRNDRQSVVVAMLGRLGPHYHNERTEVYEALEGTVRVWVDGLSYTLLQGDQLTIHPGQRHLAEGDDARVQITCTPPWIPEDNIPLEE